jgi:ankyrin repeat protein
MGASASCCCGCPNAGRALLAACEAGDLPAVAQMLDRDPSLASHRTLCSGQTPWHLAAVHGHTHILCALATAACATTPSRGLRCKTSTCPITLAKNTTALLPTMATTAPSMTVPLFSHSAKAAASHVVLPPQHDDGGAAAAARVSRLVNRGNSKGQTPLILACSAGCAEAAEWLLLNGASPWAYDSDGGRSCLHYAARTGHATCIRVRTVSDLPAAACSLSDLHQGAHGV